jgi:hypothetical protein
MPDSLSNIFVPFGEGVLVYKYISAPVLADWEIYVRMREERDKEGEGKGWERGKIFQMTIPKYCSVTTIETC